MKKGYKQTYEHRRKIGKANLNPSKEKREKMSISHIGKKYSLDNYPNYGMRKKKHSTNTKNKMFNSLIEQYNKGLRNNKGKNNPMFGVKLSEELKEKMRKAIKKSWRSPILRENMSRVHKGNKLSKEHKRKISKGNLGLHKENHSYTKNLTSEQKMKKSMAHRNWWKQFTREQRFNMLKSAIKSQYKKPNKPETFVINIIKKNNFLFNYVGNRSFWLKGQNHMYNPDFVDKGRKQIIEVYGDYWHNRPDYKERDIERLKTYKQHGYKTLIIWQHELENLNTITNKISAFIENGK